jgi:hypothetical protein
MELKLSRTGKIDFKNPYGISKGNLQSGDLRKQNANFVNTVQNHRKGVFVK